MSHFDDLVNAADPAFFDVMGKDGVYDSTTACRVIEGKEMLMLQGEESSSYHTEITLSFLASEVNPERGKLVVVGANTYKLGKQISNDGSVIQHIVEK